MRPYVRTCANVRKRVNEGWTWATALAVCAALGCLIVGVMLVSVVVATFVSLAYTLARSR